MALKLETNYNNASNFTFDTDDIEIVSSTKAALKLQFFPEEDFSEDFADDTGHTYDSDKAEFASGVVRQKDQTATGSVFAAKYLTNADPITTEANLNWHKSGGSLTAVVAGGATIVGGKLVCTGASNKGVYYTTVNSSTLALKFKYTPNYSGNPPSNVNMIAIREPTGNNNRLVLAHSPSGDNFRITLNNSSGTSIYNASQIGASGVAFVSGTEYEMELNFDAATGVIRLFRNGTLYGTLTAGAVPWANNAARVYVGANPNVYNVCDASYDDVMYFNTVQHTASYTPGYTPANNIYAETLVTLPVFTYSGPGLLRPASIPTSTETGTPRYIIQGKYWDGDSWEDSSDTYATASPKADIIANIVTFPSTGLSTVTVDVVFGDSNTQSNVDQIDFSVEGQGYAQDNPTIRPNAFTQMDGLEPDELDVLFAAVSAASGSDAVRFLLETRTTAGGPSVYKYWNGSAWATSDGTYAQSNTAAEINDNGASLDLAAGFYVRVVAFLHSDDGYSTPDLTSSEISYNFFITAESPNKTILYGWLIESDESPLQGTVTVEVKTPFFHSGNLIPKSSISTTTDENGYWEITVIETTTVSAKYTVSIEYEEDLASPVTYNNVVVPNQDSVNLEDIAA